MNKIRLLLVDDSSFIRQVLSRLLSADPDLEVVATAANGRLALSRLSDAQPDVVILDVEMPEMNGIETLAALRKSHPHLPVIMYSTLTRPGVRATIDALLLGANDYATKPEKRELVEHSIHESLIPKIKLHAAARRGDAAIGAGHQPAPLGHAQVSRPVPPVDRLTPRPRVEAIAIAASTGGPSALARLFCDLPENLPVPILIVQHMPPEFTNHLAYRLSSQGNCVVREAVANEFVSGSRGWIAPGDFHMTVKRIAGMVRAQLNQDPPVNACRPAADVLFESAAEVFGSGVLAVVLTGMGQDGREGCESIRRAGGGILVQDQASSVVWGMPGAVARSGLADQVLPIGGLAAEIVRRVRVGRGETG